LCTIEELPVLLDEIKSELNPDDFSKITVVLKIDKNTAMGTVNDIRQILRQKNLLTVYYAAEKFL